MFGKLLHIWNGKFGERKIMQTFQVLGLLFQIVYTFSHILLLLFLFKQKLSVSPTSVIFGFKYQISKVYQNYPRP